MKVCFCPLYEIDQNEVLQNSTTPPNLAVTNFNEKIMNGLYESHQDGLFIISTRTIGSFPKYKKIINSTREYYFRSLNCIEIGFINFPLLKYICEYINLYKQLKKWYLNNQSEKDLVICSYGRRISHSLAINRIKKKYPKVKTTMIFGDLSGKLATQTGKASPFVSKCVEKVLNYSIKQSLEFDGCIFLTRAMNDVLENKKPFIVLEGICSSDDLIFNESIKIKKQGDMVNLVYTGIISRQYGFDTLINAMSYLDEKKFMLLLYGIGPMVEEIKSGNYKNIKYMGYVSQNDIKNIQNDADILINPRQNTDIFTKYSFPSKTLEYLTTGNIVIGYKLDGIPDEYDDYIFYVEDNTAEALANKIKLVGQLSTKEKELYKKNVLDFLKSEKTERNQCGKIMDFFFMIFDSIGDATR